MIVPRRAFFRHSCRGPRGRDQIPAASAHLKKYVHNFLGTCVSNQ